MGMLYLRVSCFLIFCSLTFRAYPQQNNHASQAKVKNAAERGMVRRYIELARSYEDSKADSSEYYYEKARILALQINDRDGLNNYFLRYIRFLNHKAEFENALSSSLKHLAFGQQAGDSNILMHAYNEVANEDEYLGDFQGSAENFFKALKLAEQQDNKKMQRLIDNNLSSVFISLKDYKSGYSYSAKAFKLAQAAHDTTVMGDCLINMGVSQIHQKKYHPALLDFDEAEKIGYKVRDMTLVADALSDKGLVYYNLHQLTTSEKQYQKQKAIAGKYNLPFEKLYALFQLAVVKKEKGDFKTAENYASRAISLGENLNTPDELIEMYDTMSVIKSKLGKLTEAMAYKTKFESMSDSVMNAQVQTNIQHLAIQYRSAQKDKEIAQQALKIERSNSTLQRKNTLIELILAGLIGLTTILILSYRSHRHKQKLSRQQLLTLQKQHEVNTLKAKMLAREEERDRIGREMHDDIGSALTTILYQGEELKRNASEANLKSVKSITETATSVMDKMNEIIWSMNRDYDSIEDLIAYTRQHTVEFLQNHNLEYNFEIPETIPSLHLTGEQRRNIYLVIKEALHNVVKHACATKVCISFTFNDQLSVSIRDNGKGVAPGGLCRFGNGLKNMQQRMESIGGIFKISNNNGTTIHIECPIRSLESKEPGV